MGFKRNLIIILILSWQINCYADINTPVFGYDTTIIKEWNEGNARYRVEITIINAAGEEGIIPGQRNESYISIKQTRTINNRTSILLNKKDSCNAQMMQLVFYPECLQFKDLDKDGKKELCLLYEFGGDGFDERRVSYVLLEGGRLHRSAVKLNYKEAKMKYEISTGYNSFASVLPGKFAPSLKDEYNRVVHCLRYK